MENRKLENAEKAIDKFLEKNDHCFTCEFCEHDMFGPYCISPEYPLGYLGTDESTCEMHKFKNISLEKQLKDLQETWYQCWDKEIRRYQ